MSEKKFDYAENYKNLGLKIQYYRKRNGYKHSESIFVKKKKLIPIYITARIAFIFQGWSGEIGAIFAKYEKIKENHLDLLESGAI